MIFFYYMVYELLVGLAAATAQENDLEIRGKIQTAQVMNVISWCTYPVVYLFPLLGINAAQAVVAIQISPSLVKSQVLINVHLSLCLRSSRGRMALTVLLSLNDDGVESNLRSAK